MKRPAKILRTMALLALLAAIVIFLNLSFGSRNDGAQRVQLVLSASQAAQIVEVRYWPFQSGAEMPLEDFFKWMSPEMLRTPVREPDGGFDLMIPLSYDTVGIVFPRTKFTVPPATILTLWAHFSDGRTRGQRLSLRNSSGGVTDRVYLNDEQWSDAPPLAGK